MNKRIKDIMSKTLDEKFAGTWSTMDMQDLAKFAEKFAELIVRECAEVADIADENKCEWIGGNILTHFGVEEALAQPEQEPEQEPVLQDIEQYRLQMAGISTAAIGYWKETDSIHRDYDTLALRDVAKLYAKYDALYKAQPEQEPVAWAMLHDNGHFIDAIHPDEHARVEGKYIHPLYTTAQRTWVGLTDEEIQTEWVLTPQNDKAEGIWFGRRIEAKIKEKNT